MKREETFAGLGLSEPILAALGEVGYEVPTPIQLHTIPPLLEGRDVIGQAQTGTGKTAAFALPLLERLNLGRAEVQALVLTPTRELALQVAEAIHTYARHLGAVRVLPVYGGQPIGRQVERLRAGVQIVVGTPGRVMDHLRRGTMSFEALSFVVLDEADEMLRMGFIDDVEWILAEAPGEFQTALFSATMPREIRRIAEKYLDDPANVAIEQKTLTVPTVEQLYFNVSEQGKLDLLTRLLETESGEAALVFVRTKIAAADLAEKLVARGYAAEALHGDLTQGQRERVLRRLRDGTVEIVVATDVAARGLDVERITHVVNYDAPYDAESYVHRIGRTGRAGREGRAILFVTPREQRMLRDVERYTGQRIAPMKMPTKADVAARRTALFKESLRKAIGEGDLELYLALVEELVGEGYDVAEVAAAAAKLARGDRPLEVEVEPARDEMVPAEDGMVRLFVNAGRRDGVRPGDVVGAIANEADVPGRQIGAIDIYDTFTFVEIPAGLARQVLERMAETMIRNRHVQIRVATADREHERQTATRGRAPRASAPARERRPRDESDRPPRKKPAKIVKPPKPKKKRS
jgi:ATP-dependent RNA helicase DeaD